MAIADDDDGPTTSTEAAAAELLGTASTPDPKSATRVANDPDSPEVVTGSLSDFEKRAAEAEEGIKDDLDPPATKTEEKVAEAKAKDARLQRIIDTKFGGDEEKFVASLYEQQNSAAVLHREMQEIKKQLAAKPEEAPTAEEHPDLGWIAQEITALTSEEATNRAEKAMLLDEGKKLNAEILRKEGELKRADEFDAKELKKDIRDLQSDINNKALAFRNLDTRNRAIERDRRDLERRKEYAEREVLGQRDQLRNDEQRQQAAEAQEFKKFETSVEAVAKEFGIGDGEVFDDMYETVRARAAMHIRVNGAVEDLSVLTRALSEKYAKVHGMNRKADFAAKSEEKTQAARKQTSTPKVEDGPRETARPSPDKKWTPEFVRMRAVKILGS